jgi:hypothetical protein
MLASHLKPILIVSALLIVLALLSLVSTITSVTGMFRGPQGVMPGPPSGGQAPAGNGNFQPGGNTSQGGNGNFQQSGRTGRSGPSGIFRVLGPALRYVSLGISIIGILLTLASAWGVWKQKRWALNLAMVVAILFLLGSLPGLFMGGGRFFNAWRMVQNIVTGLSSVAVLFMGILPSVRDSVS